VTSVAIGVVGGMAFGWFAVMKPWSCRGYTFVLTLPLLRLDDHWNGTSISYNTSRRSRPTTTKSGASSTPPSLVDRGLSRDRSLVLLHFARSHETQVAKEAAAVEA
jgi:hypothetical protein